MAAGLPANYKPIAHYIKIGQEHATRDPVIYYWCKYYALQTAMTIDKKSPEAVKFLTSSLSELEIVKKANRDNEAISNDVVGQAHIEEYALKLFIFADNQDRSGNFNKNVVKAFYTAGYLFDVLTLFGELDEKIAENRKYSKFKAAYIHNCLKNGETPIAGPLIEEENDGDLENTHLDVPTAGAGGGSSGASFNPAPAAGLPQLPPSSSAPAMPTASSTFENAGLKMDVYLKAQKLCKQAASALDYEDEKTAIDNLQKALRMLQTGSST